MNATLDNSVNQEGETQREPDGNMLKSDDPRRSTGIVPLCTGMPTRCKTSATLRQRHRTCRRNESPPVQCELLDHLLIDLCRCIANAVGRMRRGSISADACGGAPPEGTLDRSQGTR